MKKKENENFKFLSGAWLFGFCMSPLLHGHWAMCKKPGDGIASVKGRATRTRRAIGGTFLGGCLPEGHGALLVPLEQQIPVALGVGTSVQP